MKDVVVKNRFGFYELKNKPLEKDLDDYYSKVYYQNSKGNYAKVYSDIEMLHKENTFIRKHTIIESMADLDNHSKNFLDIGCGEGWALAFFSRKGWEVTGIDYSDHGLKQQNPDCLDQSIIGNMSEVLLELAEDEKKFDVIWLDNVLEHALDPIILLNQVTKLLAHDGVLVIEVPNDFSTIQMYLLEKQHIVDPFWIAIPDHISYFNKEGLLNLCSEIGLKAEKVISDFPIDMNLFNKNTNYIQNKSIGKDCHLARVEIENLLNDISPEHVTEIYQLLGEMGLGRNITGFFKLG